MDNTSLLDKILALRSHEMSYNKIAKELGISKSTVAYWAADNRRSKAVKKSLATKQHKRAGILLGEFSRARWNTYRGQAIQEANGQFLELQRDPLFISGIMLYWGEGDSKQKNALRISNTNPRLIALYLRFLREIMKIPEKKIKIELIIYPDLKDSKCKNFWIEITRLPEENFHRTQYIQGRHPTKRLSYGVCMIVVSDIFQKMKMLTWIDIFSKQYTINP
jgi:transcriptional regulator with XRE-family HTH domain